VNDVAIEEKIEAIAAELGGNEAIGTWLAVHGYTLQGFKSILGEEMLAAQMVEQIVDKVGESTEQVHARHILVSTQEEAESLLEEINAGADFDQLARIHSIDPSTRPAGGDLGWFPRGYLLIPEVEAVAFTLQPNEVSKIVESVLGFHIVQSIERGVHPLTPDAQRYLRELAVEEWLLKMRERSEIEIYTTP
jgi:peptidyl-prolyl cis-trans isomerase C